MSEAKIWYIVVDGKADGPHAETQVNEWLRTGKLQFSSLVFRPGLSKWVTVSECKEFERREPPKESTASKLEVPAPATGQGGWTILSKRGSVDGKNHYVQSGPFTSDQIKDKLKKGEVKFEDHGWQKGMKAWTPLSAVSEFDRRGEGNLVRPESATPASSIMGSATATNPIKQPAHTATVASTGAPRPGHAAFASTTPIETFSVTLPINEDKAQEVTPKPTPAKVEPVRAAAPAPAETVKVRPSPAPKASVEMSKEAPAAVAKTEKPAAQMKLPDAAPRAQAAAAADMASSEAPTRVEPPKTEMPKGAPSKLVYVEVKSAVPASSQPAQPSSQPSPQPSPQPSQVYRAAPTPAEMVKAIKEEPAKVKAAPLKDVKKPKEAVSQQPTTAQAPQAPQAIQAPQSPQGEFIEEVNGGEISMVTSNSALRSYQRRRWLIGAVGIGLGAALAYAGMTAYHEVMKSTSEKALPRRQVAAVRSPPVNYAPPPALPPPPAAPQKMAAPTARSARPRVLTDPNQTLPDPFGDDDHQVPVNPDLENPDGKIPTVLRIVSLKLASDHPQLAFETDLPGGSVIDMQLTARAGSILRYPSFFLEKQVSVVAGTLPSVDLSYDGLPAGDYKVSARSGALTASSFLPVGVHDADFKEALAQFHKKIARTVQVETSQLKNGMKFVVRNYAGFSGAYRKAKSNSLDAKKSWAVLMKNWHKELEKELRSAPRVGERNRNNFAYPEQFMKLRATELKLSEVVKYYDRGVRSGRTVASDDDDPIPDFKTMATDLRHSLSEL